MFRGQTDLYSAWDAEGVPTHDATGAELDKAKVKKLKKEWAQQAKLHEWYVAKKAGGDGAAGGSAGAELDNTAE